MTTPDWRTAFRAIAEALRRRLPAERRAFAWSATSSMAKLWYGNRALHYEIWVRSSAKVVEVGLHFEADPLTNARLLAAFRAHAREVKRALGADARIEEWDKGWARVWEPIPFAATDLEHRARARFEDYVVALEPLLRDELPSDIEWEERAPKRATSSRSSR